MCVCWVVRKTSPLLHRVLGVFLPLITTNCAVLGVCVGSDHKLRRELGLEKEKDKRKVLF